MGASVIEDWAWAHGGADGIHDGFFNDDQAWGGWMGRYRTERTTRQVLDAVKSLSGRIMTLRGWLGTLEDVNWVEAGRGSGTASDADSCGLIQAEISRSCVILKATGSTRTASPCSGEFIRDVDDMFAMAKWAEERAHKDDPMK